ncbi:MAG: tetratricopeptide repeat protein [Candidatus Latescibacterota bacterium]
MTVWVGLIAIAVGWSASLFLPVPQNLKTNFDAGQSLYALGEYEGAILEYSKVVHFRNRAVRADSVRVKIGDNLELPVVAASWYQLGNAYKKSDKHDEAVKAYQQIVGLAGVPEQFRSMVQYQVAETRFLQAQFAEAAQEYRRYVELFPRSEIAGKAFFHSGWSEFNQKEYAKSVETLKKMLEAYPGDRYAPDAKFRIASAHYEVGLLEQAIAEAQAVTDEYPNNPIIAQSVYLKAQALDKMGRYEEAVTAYREVRGLYDRMFELLRSSFREGKNLDFEAYRELFETSSLRVAEIFRQNGQFEEAYQELVAVQEIAEERFYKAKVQMRIGDNYMEWKRYDDAWTAYNQVIELYADTGYPPNAQYNKGEARYYAGRYSEARDEYLAVIQNYPDVDTQLRALALYNAGYASEKLEDYDRVQELFNEVVENYPRSEHAPICMLRLGQLKYKNGQVNEAIETYEQLVERYGETRTGSDALYSLGVLYRNEGRTDEAVAALSGVSREAGETYVAALTARASILVEQGQAEEGRRTLEELLQRVQGDRKLEAKAYYHLAQLDMGAKKHEEAVKGFTRVIEQYPDSEPVRDARYGRGLALYNLGQPQKALADYEVLLAASLPAEMLVRVKYSTALAYVSLDRKPEATRLLNDVVASQDAELARSARLTLVTVAETQDPAEAVATYEGILPQVSEPADREKLLVRLANSYYRLGQYARANEVAQQAMTAGTSEEVKANALFIQANSLFKSGQGVQAVEAFRRVVDQYPQSTWSKGALFQVGVAYNEMSSQSTSALAPMAAAFKEFYARYPTDENAVHAYYYGAWAQYRIGNWKEASVVFAELADRFPQSTYAAEALFRGGEAEFNRRPAISEDKDAHFHQAIAFFDRLLRNHPGSDYADDALYSKAWSMINLKQEEAAMALFEEVVAKFPFDRYGPKSQFSLGDYYYSLKDYDRAKANYQRFLELYPETRLTNAQDLQLRKKAEMYVDQLGEITAYNLYLQGEQHFDNKQYGDAVKVFEEVIEKYPESAQAVNASVQIGVVYQNQQDFRQAGEVYRQVVDKYAGIPKYETQVDFAKQQLESMQKAQVL